MNTTTTKACDCYGCWFAGHGACGCYECSECDATSEVPLATDDVKDSGRAYRPCTDCRAQKAVAS